MKTYLTDIIPKIKRYSHQLDNLTLLTNKHWVIIDDLNQSKVVYIFRSNNELLISQNGAIERGAWEYLGNNSLLIERKEDSYLFRHGFLDDNVLALKVDGKDEFAFLVNENNYGSDLNSIEKVLEFLERKYLKVIPKNQIDLSPTNDEPYNEPDELLQSNTNLFPVENDDFKFGYVDSDGCLIIEYKYDQAYDFSEGLAMVYVIKDEIDYYGYIDQKGNEVIPLQFEYGESFSEGLALVRVNRKFGFIDKKGRIAIDFQYDDAQSFEDGQAQVKVNGEHFYIDLNGNEK